MRKKVAERQVKTLTQKVYLLEADISDANAQLTSAGHQIASYQSLLAISLERQRLEAQATETRLKQARRRATRKTIGIAAFSGLVGFVVATLSAK